MDTENEKNPPEGDAESPVVMGLDQIVEKIKNESSQNAERQSSTVSEVEKTKFSGTVIDNIVNFFRRFGGPDSNLAEVLFLVVVMWRFSIFAIRNGLGREESQPTRRILIPIVLMIGDKNKLSGLPWAFELILKDFVELIYSNAELFDNNDKNMANLKFARGTILNDRLASHMKVPPYIRDKKGLTKFSTLPWLVEVDKSNPTVPPEVDYFSIPIRPHTDVQEVMVPELDVFHEALNDLMQSSFRPIKMLIYDTPIPKTRPEIVGQLFHVLMALALYFDREHGKDFTQAVEAYMREYEEEARLRACEGDPDMELFEKVYDYTESTPSPDNWYNLDNLAKGVGVPEKKKSWLSRSLTEMGYVPPRTKGHQRKSYFLPNKRKKSYMELWIDREKLKKDLEDESI